ncbi:hypothetical protein [Alteromonas ponticola]|uniref:Lipoprotein n=1 Tax=Alteromonas ponticola TaxID=2720613 RepID=A0ABX1R704_9ALTE|nr:hypothetical protein [Alteromonas ponticola]NMH61257.1 hypothetical protein [Alteromonas ponticola]
MIILTGCAGRDYQKNYELAQYCTDKFEKNGRSYVGPGYRYGYDIGSVQSNCINRMGIKQFYQLIYLPQGTQQVSIWSHPNLSLNVKSFFLPQLLVLKDGKWVEIPYSKEVKGSAFATKVYYIYHYDLRNVDVRKVVVTTSPKNYGHLFEYEHLNSYDLTTIHRYKMPFAKGAKIDFSALQEWQFEDAESEEGDQQAAKAG